MPSVGFCAIWGRGGDKHLSRLPCFNEISLRSILTSSPNDSITWSKEGGRTSSTQFIPRYHSRAPGLIARVLKHPYGQSCVFIFLVSLGCSWPWPWACVVSLRTGPSEWISLFCPDLMLETGRREARILPVEQRTATVVVGPLGGPRRGRVRLVNLPCSVSHPVCLLPGLELC